MFLPLHLQQLPNYLKQSPNYRTTHREIDMPKRSIFIKIYLCFLLATMLVIAAQISLDQLIKPVHPPGVYIPHPLPPPGSFPPPGPPPFFLNHGPPPPPSTPLLLFRLFITLIISGGVCYWFARYLTSPVVKLRDATRRFAGGELTVRIGKNSSKWKDELSELAEDFDSMAERIESLLTQQRQLIRDISHELRSPLTRLVIAVELVRRQTVDETVPALDRIEKEAMLLNEMIGQVLAITRFDSHIETIQVSAINLEKLLEEVTDDANFEAHACDCTVQLIKITSCTVSGNEEWLRRAVENVVRNAVRYSHVNTTVDIRLEQIVRNSMPYAEIRVRDHGDGVPETNLPHLFRPFYRVSNARERKTGGAGLGLAITERVVKLHNGSITASNAPDGGLIVIIHLPIAPILSA
jgi:signal transduction histidine kinase